MAHVHQLHKGYRNILGGAYSSALLSLVIASLLIACGGPTLPDGSAAPTGTTTPPPPPGGDTTPPTPPSGLAASANGSFGAILSWAASTDNVAVTGYKVERCQGAGCATFAQIATAGSASFTDSGLTAATSYSYRVRATDAAANLGAFSNIASATTAAPPVGDTTPPSAPGSLAAAADGSFGATLSWTASTDNVAVTGYKVERCQGAACATFAQVATPVGASFTDSGLTAATSYSYRVRATDAAANLSAFSNIANITTAVAPPPPLPNLPVWMTGLAIGQWFSIPNTSISNADPATTPNGNWGPQSKIFAWNSVVVDTRNSKVYSVAGGGHQDYSGNEVDVLDLEVAIPAWSQVLAPTPNSQLLDCQSYYADGRPASRHSYYGLTFSEANDRFMLFGGAHWCSLGNFFAPISSYNITANTYNPAGTHPDLPSAFKGTTSFALDPSTGDVYAANNFVFGRWNRASNTFTTLNPTGSGPNSVGEAMSAMDTTRGRILILGGQGPTHHHYTLSSNTFASITLTGANPADVTAVGNAGQASLVYVAAIDRYLVRRGGAGGTVYQINPATFDVSIFATTNGGSIPGTQNGPYNKFVYVPRLGGCIYVPDYGGNVWFVRVQ